MENRNLFYSLETRWADSPFWRLRRECTHFTLVTITPTVLAPYGSPFRMRPAFDETTVIGSILK